MLLSEEAIEERVRELAARIDEDYAGVEQVVLVGVLKGSFIFLSDLARQMQVPRRIDFISLSSYGDRESEEPDSVRLLMDVRHHVGGEHVLLVEDIVDTGHTLGYLKRLFAARGPASLRVCALLHKPSRSRGDVSLDYLGFTIPDTWVVGYGLDYAERYRALPFIAELPPELR